MFTLVPFAENYSNLVCFDLENMEEHKIYGGTICYTIPAFFFEKSDRGSTKPNLIKGYGSFRFADKAYYDLPATDVLFFAEKERPVIGENYVRTLPRDYSLTKTVILGENKIWGGNYDPNGTLIESMKELISLSENLPETPEGYMGWYKFRKNWDNRL